MAGIALLLTLFVGPIANDSAENKQLLADFRSTRAEVRAEATKRLRELSIDGTGVLIEALQDRDDDVVGRAEVMLYDLGDKVIPLLRARDADLPYGARLAIRSILAARIKYDIPSWVEALADEDNFLRSRAREVLFSEHFRKNGLPIRRLLEILRDNDNDVREGVLKTILKAINDAEVPSNRTALLALLVEEKDPVLRQMAAQVASVNAKAYIAGSESPCEPVRWLAISEMKWAPNNSAITDVYVRGLKDSSAAVRCSAAVGLARIDSTSEDREQAAFGIGELLNTRSTLETALRALSSMGPPAEKTVSAVARVVESTELPRHIRIRACETLGQIGTPNAIPPLATAFQDDDEQLANAAFAAFVQIGQPAIPMVLSLTDSQNKSLRERAVIAWERINAKDPTDGHDSSRAKLHTCDDD